MAQQWDGSNWSAGHWDANNWRGPNEADTGIRFISANLTGAGEVAATAVAIGAAQGLHGRPLKRKTLRLRGRRLPDEVALPLPPPPTPTPVPIQEVRVVAPPDLSHLHAEIAALMQEAIRAETEHKKRKRRSEEDALLMWIALAA
jgi:hypothetical protein